MPDNVAVRFRDCSCPGTPHPDGDVAYLRPYLDYPGGAEALRSITKLVPIERDGEEVMVTQLIPVEEWPEHLVPVYIRRGVVGWNLVDDDGPVPVTPEALDALRWEEAFIIGDRADDFYGGQVLAPLVRQRDASSKTGPTNGSTRHRAKSSRKRRSPSGSSS